MKGNGMTSNSVTKLALQSIMSLALILEGSSAFAETWATVNGTPLTREEVSLALTQMNEGVRATFLKQPENRKRALEELIDLEVLAQQARSKKLDQTDEFKRMKVQAERELLVRLYVEKEILSSLTNSALRAFYEKNQSRYRADRYRVQQIVLLDEGEAKRVLGLASAKGADFQALAEKYSKDPSAPNNRGDLGMIPRGTFVPEFEDRIFKAKKGEIVGPISTTYGYHIVKVIDFSIGTQRPFEEVEMLVRNDLKKELLDDLLVKLRRSAKIQINSKNI